MQVFTGGKVPVNGFASERCVFEKAHQNPASDFIGLFSVSGIFKGNVADRRDELSQGGMGPTLLFTSTDAFVSSSVLRIEVPSHK